MLLFQSSTLRDSGELWCTMSPLVYPYLNTYLYPVLFQRVLAACAPNLFAFRAVKGLILINN